MFEKRKAKTAAKETAERFQHWQQQRDACAAALDLARNFNGTSAEGLLLKPGEAVFYTVTGASLVEERSGKGHWQGANTGVSFPIGSLGGRPIRYRVGATRGHYVQAPPVPAAIDTGTVYITNQRTIFEGAHQTRECDYRKLIGYTHDDNAGTTTLSVSNRQKPTVIHYGPGLVGAFDFRLELALAHFRGATGELTSQLQHTLDALEAERPTPEADPNHPVQTPMPPSTETPPRGSG
jgi:hypothetical protein